MESKIMKMQDTTPPWTRVLILVLSVTALAVLAHSITGEFIPSDPKTALIFQNALLLIVLGSTLLEHKFNKPAYSVINGLMGAITLFPVYGFSKKQLLLGLVFFFCFLCF